MMSRTCRLLRIGVVLASPNPAAACRLSPANDGPAPQRPGAGHPRPPVRPRHDQFHALHRPPASRHSPIPRGQQLHLGAPRAHTRPTPSPETAPTRPRQQPRSRPTQTSTGPASALCPKARRRHHRRTGDRGQRRNAATRCQSTSSATSTCSSAITRPRRDGLSPSPHR